MRFDFVSRSVVLGLIIPAALLLSVFTCRHQNRTLQDSDRASYPSIFDAQSDELCCFYPIWPVVSLPTVSQHSSHRAIPPLSEKVVPTLFKKNETRLEVNHLTRPDSRVVIMSGETSVGTDDEQTEPLADVAPGKTSNNGDLERAREQVASDLRVLLSNYKANGQKSPEEKQRSTLGVRTTGGESNRRIGGLSRWEMGLDMGFASLRGSETRSSSALSSQIRFGGILISPLRLVLALGASQLAPERKYVDPAVNLLTADARIEFAPRLVGNNYAFFSLGLGVIRADIESSTDGLEARSIHKPTVLLEAGLEKKMTGSLAIRVSYEYRMVDEIALAEGKTLSSVGSVKVGVSFSPRVSRRGVTDPSSDKIFAQTVQEKAQEREHK